jgi:medium-chain acyl-[acyl-carrier-protein] hydrolase
MAAMMMTPPYAAAKTWLSLLSGDAGSLPLVCFPYAGGAAHIYADWRAGLPEPVSLHAVQLPGRGRRFAEPVLESLDAVVAGVVEALGSFDDKPFVLFGHSMGALLAFETTRALRRLGRPGPLRLLVSGYRAPQLERTEPPIHDLPEAAFVAKLREFEGTPPEVFANAELLQLMLPMVRSDFALVETYRYRPEPPLKVPITAFGGLSDGHFGRDAVAAWAGQTTARFNMHMLAGSHFFLHTARNALLRMVALELEECLSTNAQQREMVRTQTERER